MRGSVASLAIHSSEDSTLSICPPSVAAHTSASYEVGAAWLETLADAHDLPMPKEHLVRVIHALIEGLVVLRLLTPELFPDQVVYAAFGALAAAARPESHTGPD